MAHMMKLESKPSKTQKGGCYQLQRAKTAKSDFDGTTCIRRCPLSDRYSDDRNYSNASETHSIPSCSVGS